MSEMMMEISTDNGKNLRDLEVLFTKENLHTSNTLKQLNHIEQIPMEIEANKNESKLNTSLDPSRQSQSEQNEMESSASSANSNYLNNTSLWTSKMESGVNGETGMGSNGHRSDT